MISWGGHEDFSAAPLLLVFATLLKFGPYRDHLHAAVAELSSAEHIELQQAEPRVLYQVLAHTLSAASGQDMGVWPSVCNRGRMVLLHGAGFAIRLGLLSRSRPLHHSRHTTTSRSRNKTRKRLRCKKRPQHSTLKLEGREYNLLPFGAGLCGKLALLGPLQAALRIFFNMPSGTQFEAEPATKKNSDNCRNHYGC